MFLKEEWSNIMANTLISIVFVIVCVFLTVVVLMQEGKTRGLGIADSYWGKNKGRSVEGTLENMTKAAAVLFMVLAFVLNIVK